MPLCSQDTELPLYWFLVTYLHTFKCFLSSILRQNLTYPYRKLSGVGARAALRAGLDTEKEGENQNGDHADEDDTMQE